ncbi:MAG: DoxX family membrane protein [Verrucomicrobiota bacterium]
MSTPSDPPAGRTWADRLDDFFHEEANWGGATWGFLVLRFYLAVTMILGGFGKFENPDKSVWELGFTHWQTNAQNMLETFSASPLPNFMLVPYVYGLGLIEFVLGVFLLVGVKTKWTLAAVGLLFVSLSIGLRLLGNFGGAANIGVYCLVTVIALMLVRANRLEVWR